MSSKPPFHQINGKRQYIQRNVPESPHQEVIKYIHDTWKNVCREIEVTRSCGADGKVPSVAYYNNSMTDEQLPCPDFKPFDLESFQEERSLAFQAGKQSQ